MCLYPTLIKNPKYKKTAKNGGKIPPINDIRVTYVPIGCTNCIECRKQKARGWQLRLLEDIKEHKNGKFICLTFSNESIQQLQEEIPETLEGYDQDNAIATLAVKRFRERWRKKYGKSIRHWLVTELGHKGTQHLHIHGIVWTDTHLIDKKTGEITTWDKEITQQWQYGYVWTGTETRKGNKTNYVSERTINYMVKYMTKVDEQHKEYKQIILTSKGIGSNYTKSYDSKKNKYQGEKTEERYRTSTGHKMAMPIYWRNKIYSEKEREQLWLNRLDKQERWVCGEKVSIKHNDKEYWALVKWHRKRNKELGYGELPNWEQKQTEYIKRNIKIHERTTRAKEKTAKTSIRRKSAKAINKMANTKAKTQPGRQTKLRRKDIRERDIISILRPNNTQK